MGIISNMLFKGAEKVTKDLFGGVKEVTVGNVVKAKNAVGGYVKEIKEEAAKEGFEAEINNRTIEKLADAKADAKVKAIMAAEKTAEKKD